MATGKMQTERRAGFNEAATDTDDIETIVFTAIATTGWPKRVDPASAKITALCFMPISKVYLKNRKTKRIPNKLIIYCNPEKEIDSKVAEASGLTKDDKDLSDCPTFDQQARLVLDFLKNLPQPIRLVAHQGDIFHFRLLFLHLSRTIPVSEFQGLFCTDSLKVAKEMAPHLKSRALDELHKLAGGEPIVGAEGRCQMLLEIVRKFGDKQLEEFFTLCGRIKCMFSDAQFDENEGQLCVHVGEMGRM